jgi:hypothetical protein
MERIPFFTFSIELQQFYIQIFTTELSFLDSRWDINLAADVSHSTAVESWSWLLLSPGISYDNRRLANEPVETHQEEE